MSLYRGYSTIEKNKTTRLVDADLIKRDLINHFHIRKGEKLMQPNFGTIIWDSLFEPLTERLKNAIVDDVTTIARYDPRLQVDQILVDQFEHGILIELRLFYTLTNETETLKLIFDRRLETRNR